jgi:hypothetical protein
VRREDPPLAERGQPEEAERRRKEAHEEAERDGGAEESRALCGEKGIIRESNITRDSIASRRITSEGERGEERGASDEHLEKKKKRW